jgi:hypothetical protein
LTISSKKVQRRLEDVVAAAPNDAQGSFRRNLVWGCPWHADLFGLVSLGFDSGPMPDALTPQLGATTGHGF